MSPGAAAKLASTHPKINYSVWKYKAKEELGGWGGGGVSKRINAIVKSTYQILIHVLNVLPQEILHVSSYMRRRLVLLEQVGHYGQE